MPHPRALARKAVVARLMNATSAGTRVFNTRIDAYKKTEIPAISVYTPSEAVDGDSEGREPRELKRELVVEIAGCVPHSAGHHVADAMDAMSLEIETAMDVDRGLDGTAGECILESTEMDVLKDADPVVGVVLLTYRVTYRTEPAALTLDDFLRMKATNQIVGGVDDTVPAIDEFTVQDVGGFSLGFSEGFQ